MQTRTMERWRNDMDSRWQLSTENIFLKFVDEFVVAGDIKRSVGGSITTSWNGYSDTYRTGHDMPRPMNRFSYFLRTPLLKSLSLSLSLSWKWSEKRSHSKCMGLHFVLCSTKKVGQSSSGSQFKSNIFVSMRTKSHDTGLHQSQPSWIRRNIFC